MIILSLGSNLGNRKANLEMALSLLEWGGAVHREVSCYYESDPWGFETSHRFLNMVSLIDTKHNPTQLIALIHDIESRMGRKRSSTPGYQSRIIDIDVVAYGRLIIETPIILPHPRAHEREFVLIPIREIAPKWRHPVYDKTASELLQSLVEN